MPLPLPSPRLVRLAILLAAAATLVAARSRGGRDLALHKPVRISSVLLGDPAGVVNGFVEWGSYAVHTRSQGPAWLIVDLEAPARVGDVRVSGRGDGFFTEQGPPMVVEVSDDGVSFHHAVSCDPIVTQASPCRVAFGGVPARYVRVRHASHLVLSEV
jgi:hypothetical protein